jgi:serine/threonine-protein kinase
VFDFGAWDNRFYLVMELVEGHSLAQELTAAGTLGPERVAAVAAQAAAGLAAAHREGIVHRDIKPGNLLSDAQGTVKIGDFGIARFVDDPASALTTAGQIVGTSLYLAPERALGRPASAASDVYSLGCVLYQLLTGRPPFQGESATVTLHQHIDMAPVPPRERGAQLPPAFENYLLGLLAKQPADRPTAQEVADWFGTGAWQGRAEPLPMASAQTPTSPATSGPASAYAASPPHIGSAETGPPTMYRLPPTAAHAAHSAPSAPSRRARSGGGVGGGGGVGAMVRRRPRVLGILAGAVLFVLAVLAGMSMFSPDNTAAEPGGQDTPSATDATNEAPAAGTVARTQTPTPTPDVGTAPPASPSFTETPAVTPSPAEDKEKTQEKPPKEDGGGEEYEDEGDGED